MKPVVVEHHPEVNSLPVRTVEQLVPEVQSDDGAKESLEPAASAYGIFFLIFFLWASFHLCTFLFPGYRGWGGYGGYGGGGEIFTIFTIW